MWINVPHPAWDDWIENAARLVADSLDRDLKVYVEYSNEIWNWAGAYPQSQWILRNGRWTHAPEWDCADSIYEALSAINPEPRDHPEKDAYMVNRTLRIWRSVFEEKGQRGRLVRVAAYQGGYSSIFRRLVNWLFTNGDGCDVVAPDAYFGIKHTVAHFDSVDTLPGQAVTTQQILDSASAAISRAYQENDSSIASLAEEYSLGIVTYEAGDHMFDYKSHTWDAALQAASSDSGIYDVYMDNFRHWGEAMNSELCVLYSSKRTFYHFGHVEDYSQIYLPREQMLRQAPKYLAALEANVERTPVARRSRGRTSIQGLSPRIRVTSGVVRIFPAVAGRLDVRLLDLAGRTLTHVRYDVAEKQDAVAVRVPRRLAGRAYVVEVKHAGTGTTRLLTVAP